MTRLFAPVLALALLLSTLVTASAGSPATPSAPSELAQWGKTESIAPGAWRHFADFEVHMKVAGTGGWLKPQVEVEPIDTAFKNAPNFTGHSKMVSSGASATLFVHVSGLGDGAYVWQARVTNSHGDTSAWTPFTVNAGDPSIRIDTTAPSAPHISSSTNPKRGSWYRTKIETFDWTARDAGSGISRYSYKLTHTLHAPRPDPTTTDTTTFKKLSDGKWVLHVWARDKAGNWSVAGLYRFNLMRHSPKVHFKHLWPHHFNPYSGGETWSFSLSRPAKVRVEIDGSNLKHPVYHRKLGKVSSGVHTFVWHGRNSDGHVVKHGWYWLRVYTRDSLGNRSSFAFGGVQVWPFHLRMPYYSRRGRHIVVSLKKEAIYAYKGSRLVRWSLATTGNPALKTPTGHFNIFAKFHPFQFVSPWPQGSPYYYAPSWTSFAMEFDSGGYFIHDAPWRSVFGPGSDGPGQPGTNYGGTHGCVNVPYKMAKFLFYWAPTGTPVDILG